MKVFLIANSNDFSETGLRHTNRIASGLAPFILFVSGCSFSTQGYEMFVLCRKLPSDFWPLIKTYVVVQASLYYVL